MTLATYWNKIQVKLRDKTADKNIAKEVFEDKCYERYINPTQDDVWLDAGANVGFFAVSIADRVKFVYSFEPENGNYLQLLENVGLNGITNVIPLPFALVGNDDTTRTFYVSKLPNQALHTLLGNDRTYNKLVVNATNINTAIEYFGINKIKMDVEGAEYELFKAIRDDLWAKIDEIVLEFHFGNLHDHPEHKKFKEVVAILEKHFPYQIYNECKVASITTMYAGRTLKPELNKAGARNRRVHVSSGSSDGVSVSTTEDSSTF